MTDQMELTQSMESFGPREVDLQVCTADSRRYTQPLDARALSAKLGRHTGRLLLIGRMKNPLVVDLHGISSVTFQPGENNPAIV